MHLSVHGTRVSSVQLDILSIVNLDSDTDLDVYPLSSQGPVNHVRTVSIGEKRQPAPSTHTTVNKSHALLTQVTKSTPGTRYAAEFIDGSLKNKNLNVHFCPKMYGKNI